MGIVKKKEQLPDVWVIRTAAASSGQNWHYDNSEVDHPTRNRLQIHDIYVTIGGYRDGNGRLTASKL